MVEANSDSQPQNFQEELKVLDALMPKEFEASICQEHQKPIILINLDTNKELCTKCMKGQNIEMERHADFEDFFLDKHLELRKNFKKALKI